MSKKSIFVMAFREAPLVGESTAESREHVTLVGHLQEDPLMIPRIPILEHVEELQPSPAILHHNELKTFGDYLVVTLQDHDGAFMDFRNRLYCRLVTSGYNCLRPDVYRDSYSPHVSLGRISAGATLSEEKITPFEFRNIVVTESYFDDTGTLLKAHAREVLSW